MKNLAIIGAGGFARELKWLLDDINRVQETYSLAGYLVSDLARLGERDSRDEVLGDLGWLAQHQSDIDALALGIGTPEARRRLGRQLTEQFPNLEWPAIVHPSVKFDAASCKFGRGVILCAGVIATVNVTFKDFSMVNLSCTVGHESVIGEGCVLNPSVNISGGVVLEDGVLVGTGAQVLQYLRIGTGAIVGSGAVVIHDVEAGLTVSGIPARPLVKRTP